ncbi:MAG TPA: hypothetical protein VGJ84_05935, partial [Polyangiaceae bacterium]
EIDSLALAEGKKAEQPKAAAPAPARQRAAEEEGAPAESRRAADPCETACQAFSSLERAGRAVCRLGGDASERCHKARKMVEDGRKRVSSCGCG